jgi:hypothetical protein
MVATPIVAAEIKMNLEGLCLSAASTPSRELRIKQ